MAQTGYTPIQIYSSSTALQVPLAVNLTNNTLGSELAINITDGKLYYKDNGGTVQLLASKAGASGDVVGPASATDNAVARFDLTTGKLIQNSVVTIGDTGDVTGVAALTTSGSLTLSGGTANGILYLNGSKVATSGSALVFDGTNFSTTGTATATKLIPTGNVTAGNGMYLPATNTLAWSTNGAEGMRLDASGNLYLNTTSRLSSGVFSVYYVPGTSQGIVFKPASDTSTPNPCMFLNAAGSSVGTIFTNSTATSYYTSGVSGVIGIDANTIAFNTNSAERMRIDSSGNVGIGTTSPIYKLDVRGEANSYGIGTIASGTTGQSYGLYIQAGTNSSDAALSITDATGVNSYLRVRGDGNVGIGTTSPSQKLHIIGTSSSGIRLDGGSSNAAVIEMQADPTTSNGVQITATYTGSGSYGPMKFNAGGAERMRIDSSGNLGLGVTPSAWSDGKVIEVGSTSTMWNDSIQSTYFLNNANYNSGFKYKTTGANAVAYLQAAEGKHVWYNAPSGTAGNTITFTQAMTLDASGNLGIGTTTVTNVANYKFVATNGSTGGGLVCQQSGTDRFAIYNANSDGYYDATSNHVFRTGGALDGTERMRIHASGGVSIGSTTDPGAGDLLVFGGIGAGNVSPTALLTLAAGTATANTGPLKFTSGTNLTTPEAGAVEYDGTVMTATSNTSFKRGTIPLTNYVSGAGTNLTGNGETTLQNLLPAANDTITLPSGTYFLDMAFTVTRTGTSNTSATARLNILGGGNAAGNFTGMSISAIIAGGAANNFSFSAVNINTSNVLTAASTTVGGVYTMTLRGMLKITTAGTIVPQYNLSATLGASGAGGASVSVLYMRLQQIDSQNNTTVGPAGTGWA